MPVTESVQHAQHAGAEIEQTQPAVGHPLSPHHSVVALGLPALVILGRLINGDHGDHLAVGERPAVGDPASPGGQCLGLTTVESYPVQLPV